jgi:hypothetical protein
MYVIYLVGTIIRPFKGANVYICFITSFKPLKNGRHHVFFLLDEVLKLKIQINLGYQNLGQKN